MEDFEKFTINKSTPTITLNETIEHRITAPQKRIINQGLIDELNQFMIRIKAHLFDELKEIRQDYPKLTIREIDEIHAKVEQVLYRNQESYIKH